MNSNVTPFTSWKEIVPQKANIAVRRWTSCIHYLFLGMQDPAMNY